MNTTKITHVAHLVEICVQHGIKKVVMSPGSRNAPLVIAFEAHPQIELFLIHDERSAAFFALGLAEENETPVAITCTSGSAPANYAPALVEAYYRNIPLLVLTADRPSEWVDQGDGQTMRQQHLYQNFIRKDFQLPDFPDRNGRMESDKIVNEALNCLNTVPKGPVHINVPLAEPLYEVQYLEPNPVIKKDVPEKKQLSVGEKEEIAKGWINAPKKLVLIGQAAANYIPHERLSALLNDPSVAVIVENTSNVHDFYKIVHCIDRTLATIQKDEIADFVPDLLVTMGGAVISKRIKAFFRKNKPVANWRVGEYAFVEDTYSGLTCSYDVHPVTFFKWIENLECKNHTNYGSKWKQRDFQAQEIHANFLVQAPYSDLKVFDLFFDMLPQGSRLHMGNSSVVRYCQLFDPVRAVRYYSNRGVSGIDGSASTAGGIAVSSPDDLNVLVTGDISFFYDSNAFWNTYLSSNFKIIVMNNGGGGIFKIIDGPSKSEQASYFIAQHQAKVEGICEAFNLQYRSAGNLAELSRELETFFLKEEHQRPVVLEVNTSAVESEKILKEYFKELGFVR